MTREVNPEVLRVARESRGRVQQDIERATGVAQGLQSKAENGYPVMNAVHVAAIAEYLGYPVRLFYEPGRIRETGSACLYHRKRKTLPQKVLRRLDARMFIRNLNMRKLFADLDIEGDRIFQTIDVDAHGGSPVEVARALRAAWRVPDGPIQNLTALIESAGGVVIREDFGNRKLFGMSCWMSRDRPLFFLNSAIPTADLRWTMAHELGHLTMHAFAPEGDPEDQAEAFAGEFLAPRARFRNDARGLTFDRLGHLKAYWRISMKAVIKYSRVIDAVDDKTALRLYKQYSARGYNTLEPYPVPDEPPTLVDQAIQIHLRDHGYTRDQLAEAVCLAPNEFTQYFLHEQPRGSNVVNLYPRPSAVSSA